MISHDLHAVGFDFPTWEGLLNASLDKEKQAAPNLGGWEYISPYTDLSGARLQRYYSDESWCTSTSFVATHSRWSARIGMINDFVALVDLLDMDGDTFARLTMSMDDAFLYPKLDGPQNSEESSRLLGDVSAVALAVEVNVFPNVESWRGNESLTPATAETMFGPVRVLGEPGYIICLWGIEYFRGGVPQEIKPYSQLVLQVTNVEIRTNQLSGVSFYVARGQLLEGLPELEVCLPLDAGDVQVGSIIDGVVMMVGSSGVWEL